MRTPLNTRLKKPFLLACLFLLSLLCQGIAQINPEYGTADPDCSSCEDQDGGNPAGDPVSASLESINLTFNLGGAGYERPNMFSSFFATAGTNADDPDLPQGVGGLRSYFDASPSTGLWNATLRLKSPVINAAAFKPESLTYNTAMKMTVLKDPNTQAVRQVLTRQFIVDVLPLLAPDEGFTANWYLIIQKNENTVNGFYTFSGAAVKTVTVSNPTPNTYTIMNVEMVQGARQHHYRYSFAANTHTLQTRETSTGPVLEEETITYTSDTPGSNDQDRIRTVKLASLDGTGSLGAPVTVSRTREVYADITGKKRLVSLTRCSSETGTAGPTTYYGYYNTPTNPELHARPRWQVNSDGSWIVWDINTSGTYPVITEITPFMNSALTVDTNNPAADPTSEYTEDDCRVVTRTIIGSQMVTAIKVKGAFLSTSTEDFMNGNNGERILRTVGNGATTYTAFNQYGTGTTAGAACIAWQTREDGTATVYTYSGNTTTAVTGAVASVTDEKSAPIITSGTCTVTTYNENADPIAEARYYGTNSGGIPLESWSSELTDRDTFGRPTKKTWTFGTAPGGTETLAYDCCGLASQTTLDGTTTSYDRDPLKRVYKTVTKVGDPATPASQTILSTNTTAYNGPTTTYNGPTTTSYQNGIFQSEITRSLDGLTTTTVSPSRNAEADRVVTRSVTNPATRTTTQAYQIGSAWNTGSNGTTTQTTTHYRDGRTASVTDEEGHDTTYTYSISADYGGILTTATSGARVSTTHTDPLDRTRKTTSPGSGTTTYAYYGYGSSDPSGSRGKLKTLTDADGVATTYGYNDKGEQISTSRMVPAGGGNSYTLTTTTTSDVVSSPPAPYTSLGTCHRQIEKIGIYVLATTYRSIDGLKSARVTPNGNTLTVTTRPTFTAGGASTTSHPDGTITHTTTSLDRTIVMTARYAKAADPDTATPIASTTSTYDSLGRLLTVTDSRTGVTGRSTYSNFTESGTPLKTTTPNGDTITTLDPLGRATETYLPGHTSANPRVIYASYYPSGRVQAQWGSQTYPTYNIYNGEGQLTELHTYRNLATSPVDNDTGGPVTTGSPAITTWNYSPTTGLLNSKLDNDSKGPSYTYTAAGRIKTRLWARGRHTAYAYTNGLLTAVTYTGTDTTWQTYLTARTTYNTVDGNPASTEEEKAAALAAMNTAYAAFSSTADTATSPVAITYDSLGRRKSVTNTLATSVFVYADDFGVDTETITYTLPGQDPFTRVLDRRDRSLGRDTGWDLGSPGPVDPNGVPTVVDIKNTAIYGYSTTTGRLESVAGNSSGTFIYGYETNSNLIKTVTRPGLLTGQPALRVTNTWEPTRNVLLTKANELVTGGIATGVSSITYTVNEIGQRKKATRTRNGAASNTTDWLYDDLGQVTSADDTNTDDAADRAYAYDTIGNRLTSAKGTYVTEEETTTFNPAPNGLTEYFGSVVNGQPTGSGANLLNQYKAIKTGAATVQPFHDDDGNMTAGPLQSGAVILPAALVWDAENRLISTTVNGVVTTYLYDAQSRRIASKVGTGPPTLYLYDGWNVIAEYRVTLANPTAVTPTPTAFDLAKSYLWGLDLSGTLQGAGGVGGLLSETQFDIPNSTFVIHYPAYDGNGNVTEYLSQSGVVKAHFEYDPFGNLTADSESNAASFPYRFSTKPQDATTGLYYYGYRYYDPVTGRWPSRDPIEEMGGINLYGFVGNDGVNELDILGFIEGDPDDSMPPGADPRQKKPFPITHEYWLFSWKCILKYKRCCFDRWYEEQLAAYEHAVESFDLREDHQIIYVNNVYDTYIREMAQYLENKTKKKVEDNYKEKKKQYAQCYTQVTSIECDGTLSVARPKQFLGQDWSSYDTFSLTDPYWF